MTVLLALSYNCKYMHYPNLQINTIMQGIENTEYWIQDTVYWILATGNRIQDTGYRILDTGYRIQDTGYRIQDTEYRILYSRSFRNVLLQARSEQLEKISNTSYREFQTRSEQGKKRSYPS